MDYRQLMIGDWVLINRVPVQLTETKMAAIWSGDKSHLDTKGFEPIPLTPEILEANDFEYREDDNEWWHYDDYPFSDFQIGFEDDDDMRMMNSCDTTNVRVNYVHELQHALRVCKLDDLADDFVVPREPGQAE